MPSLAAHIADAIDRRLAIPSDTFDSILPGQFETYFADLCRACPSRIELGVERRRRNALNVEIGAPVPRCAERSPDGRGRAWLRSGGSPLAYGPCSPSGCWRTKKEKSNV